MFLNPKPKELNINHSAYSIILVDNFYQARSYLQIHAHFLCMIFFVDKIYKLQNFNIFIYKNLITNICENQWIFPKNQKHRMNTQL